MPKSREWPPRLAFPATASRQWRYDGVIGSASPSFSISFRINRSGCRVIFMEVRLDVKSLQLGRPTDIYRHDRHGIFRVGWEVDVRAVQRMCDPRPGPLADCNLGNMANLLSDFQQRGQSLFEHRIRRILPLPQTFTASPGSPKPNNQERLTKILIRPAVGGSFSRPRWPG